MGICQTCLLPEPASVIHVWGRESLLISSRKKQPLPVRRRLDADRACMANALGYPDTSRNTFDAIAKPESFSLLYLNPPYDSEIGSAGNNRMERLFLEYTYPWLVMDGVVAMVIAFERLYDCAGILSSHFSRLNVFRMTDKESVQYRQIAVLEVRRNERGGAVEENERQLQDISPYGSFNALRELNSSAFAPYVVTVG